MSPQAQYTPGNARGAQVDKAGDKWTLVITRDLRHPPAMVWEAITDPAQLREWAPFDADRSLARTGTAELTTIGAPEAYSKAKSAITRADAPRVLEYSWGGNDMKWELQPFGSNGTRLTLWHNIERGYIAMGAAGWHICFDVLESTLDGAPIGRMVGPQLMGDPRWQGLNREYAEQFGVAPMPAWGNSEGGNNG